MESREKNNVRLDDDSPGARKHDLRAQPIFMERRFTGSGVLGIYRYVTVLVTGFSVPKSGLKKTRDHAEHQNGQQKEFIGMDVYRASI